MSLPQELANRMEPLARKMYFSKDSIAHFKEVATPGQARAFCELLDFEMGGTRAEQAAPPHAQGGIPRCQVG